MEERAFKDGQVWEKDGMLVQVNDSDGTYLVAAFTDEDGTLSYSGSVVFTTSENFKRYVDRLGLVPSEKVITLCRRGC